MPEVTQEKNDQVAKMNFGAIYKHYLNRIEKNGRTKQELDQVISWLTGYNSTTLNSYIAGNGTFAEFFTDASLHKNASLIKGVVCGYRIEEIPEKYTIYRDCRRLEKLIDELAKGRAMEKILRQ